MATARTRHLKKQPFIEAYRALGTITAAAESAGIPRGTHYDWLKNDAEYAAEFAHAEEAVADMLEQEAIRRAAYGVDEPVWHQGQQVGSVRKFSDTLLIFLLKGHRPEKFKDRAQVTSEVTVHAEDSFTEAIRELEAELDRRSPGRGAVATDAPATPEHP